MDDKRAPEAQSPSSARVLARPLSGLRRMTLAMLATAKLAEDFQGPKEGQGATRPGQVLAAFKGAAPYLGYSPRVVHAVDWLFTFTQAQDWTEGSRPIVWPSAAVQREAFAIGPSQAKAINRHLVELGLVVMKDSPNGKRYGKRDRQGRITEAYGFDLSPLFARMAEFHAVAEEGRALRERMRHLRRRTTIARNGLIQILETVAELDLVDASWLNLESEAQAFAQSLKRIEQVEEMELGVGSLERRQLQARERLEDQIAASPSPMFASIKSVDTDPKGSKNRPHYNNYKPSTHPQKDTVAASERSKSRVAGSVSPAIQPRWPKERQEGQGALYQSPGSRTDHGTVLRINPEELVQLAPRLRLYLRSSSPAWPEIVEAASWLRHDLSVSKPLWGDACLVLGREQAAIALAVVSSKPPEHFTSSAAGYFHGMIERAKTGQLNLARTIWGLRQNRGRANPSTRHRNGRGERGTAWHA
jgi:replication initiation protein RepC